MKNDFFTGVAVTIDEDSKQLHEVAQSFCAGESDMEQVRRLIEDGHDYDPEVYAKVVELGWPAMTIPEEYDGLGLPLLSSVLVSEEMGKHLMSLPFAQTVMAGEALNVAGNEEQKRTFLPKLSRGSVVATALLESDGEWNSAPQVKASTTNRGVLLTGSKVLVQHADAAELVLVSARDDAGATVLVVLDGEALAQVKSRKQRVIDTTRNAWRLDFDGVAVDASHVLDGDKSAAALERMMQVQTLLMAADMTGGARSVLDVIVSYLNEREQFGRKIGSYQALKHPAAELHVRWEQSRSLLYAAATHVNDPQGVMLGDAAAAWAVDTFKEASDRAIQFHGGFGFTFECDAGIHRRRAMFGEALTGDARYHRSRFANAYFGG